MWDLSRENIPYKWTRAKWMDEKRIAKPFEMEQLIDEQMMKIFQTDEVERMNRWRKFLNGWMADKNKYLNGWGWTSEKNFWTDEVKQIKKFLNS